MKKFLAVMVFLLFIFCGFIIYDTYAHISVPLLEIQDEYIEIDKIYIYGTNLNISSSHKLSDDSELVLYNGNFISYPLNITEDGFNVSDFLNGGIYLDDISLGEYYLFIRVKVDNDNDDSDFWKYYAVQNNTIYKKTTYYTLSKYNKKIVIKNEDVYPTMKMIVTNNYEKNVYDIVIDPGHGGIDGGASKYGYKETDFTFDIATKIKDKLELDGFKVKLTYDKEQFNSDKKLPEYGNNGRAVLPRKLNAKFLFSIHFNSSNSNNVNGLEIYTAKGINYDFANTLVKNITTMTGLKFSTNNINKVSDGIYSRNFTEAEIKKSFKDYEAKELMPYDISINSNYYYMIRETGGIVTGAYVDSRNSSIMENPYVNANVGTEAYLLELGYISNKNDLDNIINNEDAYISSIVDSIKTLYSKDT